MLFRTLFVALLAFAQASVAIADSPIIWGPNNRAKSLTSSGLALSKGATIDSDGNKNYVLNPSGYPGTTGYTSSGAMTLTRVTTGLPSAFTGVGLQLAAGAAADYVRYCFTVDAVDTFSVLGVNFNQVVASYTSGDIAVEVHSFTTAACGGTDTKLALPSDSSGVTGLPNATMPMKLNFSATGGLYYGVYFVRKAGTSTLTFSNLAVGPYQNVTSANVAASRFYTPTITGFGTPSGVAVSYQQVGDIYNVEGTFVTGTPTAVGATITLPNNYTANSSLSSAGVNVGKWIINTSSATSRKNGIMLAIPGQSTIYFTSDDYNAGATPFGSLQGSNMVGTGIAVSFFFNISANEILGSGTVNLINNDPQFASNFDQSNANDTTSFAYGPFGSQIPNVSSTTKFKDVQFTTPFQIGEKPVVEVTLDGGNSWWDVGQTNFAPVTNTTGIIVDASFFSSATPTKARVYFAGGGQGATSIASANPWSTYASNNTYRWRVRKFSGSGVAPYSTYKPGISSGLVSSAGLAATTNSTSGASYGTPGYVISSNANFNIPATTGNLTSVTLLPGRWRAKGTVCLDSTPSSRTYVQASLTLTSGAIGTYGLNSSYSAAFLSGGSALGCTYVPDQYYYVTAPTTVLYLTGNSSAAGTGGVDHAYLQAEELP